MFNAICKTEHQKIAAGTCRWCGLAIFGGRYSAEVVSRALNCHPDAGSEWVIPVLLESLESDDVRVRGAAARQLGRFPAFANEIVPSLSSRRTDSNEGVRQAALEGLMEIGSPDALREALSLATSFGDPRLRMVLWSLERLGPDAKSCVPALVEILRTSDSDSWRAGAAAVLGTIGRSAIEAREDLKNGIARETGLGFLIFAEALWRVDPTQPEILEALERAKRHEEPEIGILATFVRWCVDGNDGEALSVLVPALRAESFPLRLLAAEQLGKMGSNATSALSALSDALDQCGTARSGQYGTDIAITRKIILAAIEKIQQAQ